MGSGYSAKFYQGGLTNLAESTIQSLGVPKWALSYLCPYWGTLACLECTENFTLVRQEECNSECWDCESNYLCPCWRCDRLCDSCPDLSNCEHIKFKSQRKANLEWLGMLLEEWWFC